MFPKKSKILICDDSKICLKLITNILEESGFLLIEQAKNGEQVIECLERKTSRYDLLLLDCNMPGIMGVDLIKNIRESEKYKDLSIIMVSAETEKSVIVKALKNGVNDYLIKPVVKEDLIKKMNTIWQKIPMETQSNIILRAMEKRE